ncbi:MAG: thiamine phosphate synthase [Candidatus Krumholzibacteriia bacterium]
MHRSPRERTAGIDWSLYLVTDRALARGRSLPDLVSAAIRGGVTVVQIREKGATTREFLELTRALLRVTRAAGVPLLVNDRADVALVAGADGLHVGQDDLPGTDARRLLGPGAILGLSVENLEQVRAAESLDVDYLGVSPIHSTPTKSDTRGAFGLAGLREARRLSRHPLVAIGGLHAGNAAETVAAGADGVAVVSAICAADDCMDAARNLRAAIAAARAGAPR